MLCPERGFRVSHSISGPGPAAPQCTQACTGNHREGRPWNPQAWAATAVNRCKETPMELRITEAKGFPASKGHKSQLSEPRQSPITRRGTCSIHQSPTQCLVPVSKRGHSLQSEPEVTVLVFSEGLATTSLWSQIGPEFCTWRVGSAPAGWVTPTALTIPASSVGGLEAAGSRLCLPVASEASMKVQVA